MSIPGSASPLFLSAAAAAEEAAAGPTRSLRFNSGDSAYLARTPSSAGNRTVFTFSFWLKRTNLGSNYDVFSAKVASGTEAEIYFDSSNRFVVWFRTSNTVIVNKVTTQVFRDTGAWQHFVVSSNGGTSFKIYHNGAEITDFSTDVGPSSTNTAINAAVAHNIGRWVGASNYLNGYLADIHFIDGSALDATSFGAYDDNGVWQAKAFSGSVNHDPSYGLSSSDIVSSTGFQSGEGADKVIDSTDPTANRAHTVAGNAGEKITVTFSPAVTVNTSLEIYAYLTVSGDSEERRARVNGGDWFNPTSTADTYHDLGFTGSLNKIEIEYNGSTNSRSMTMRGIRIDGNFVYSGTAGVNGFHLLDFANESTVGHDSSGNDNDFTANNIGSNSGPVYSNYVSGYINSLNSSYPTTNLFDGSTSTIVFSSSTSGSGIKFVPPTAITGSIELYLRNGDTDNSTMSYSLDGGSSFTNVTTTGGNGSYVNIGSQTIGTTNGIIVRHITTAGTNSVNWRAIRVDGTVLTDGSGADLDVLFDVPTNGTQSDTGAGGEVSGNYATLNPLAKGDDATLSNGNLDISHSTSQTRGITTATHGMSSGKWYFEVTVTASSSTNTYANFGITSEEFDGGNYVGHQATGYGYLGNGNKYNNGSGSSYGDTFGAGDVIGIAFDADGGNLYFYKNGVAQNSGTAAFTGLTSGPYFAAAGDGSTNDTFSASFNFGQRAFAYSAKSGYKALNTASMSAATIADGSDYFDAVTYTSDGQASKKLTFGFSPDLFWSKVRNFTEHHVLHDSVRGATKVLKSSSTAAESTEASNRGVLSFDSDGVTIGIGSPYNSSGTNAVVWAWDAGSSTASNTDGSITAQVRASQTSGFSVVTYTGNGSSSATVGHGLNAVPGLIIHKRRNSTASWQIKHSSLSSNHQLEFSTSASGDVTTFSSGGLANLTSNSTFGFTSGTSGVNNVNASGGTYVCYCFAPVDGYQALGQFTGNADSGGDGPFVHTGFAVQWLIIKGYDASNDNWKIFDNTRSTFNVVDDWIAPNTGNAETTSNNNKVDFLSNGFKLRTTGGGDSNLSNKRYIYLAIAENPFQANGGLAR